MYMEFVYFFLFDGRSLRQCALDEYYQTFKYVFLMFCWCGGRQHLKYRYMIIENDISGQGSSMHETWAKRNCFWSWVLHCLTLFFSESTSSHWENQKTKCFWNVTSIRNLVKGWINEESCIFNRWQCSNTCFNWVV